MGKGISSINSKLAPQMDQPVPPEKPFRLHRSKHRGGLEAGNGILKKKSRNRGSTTERVVLRKLKTIRKRKKGRKRDIEEKGEKRSVNHFGKSSFPGLCYLMGEWNAGGENVWKECLSKRSKEEWKNLLGKHRGIARGRRLK